jgi:4-hydroxy-3-polyprenylbenzoate decarboxylase
VALAITGASGAPYGLRLLECLLGQGVEVHLMLSKPGQLVIGMETDVKLPARPVAMRRFLAERFGAAEGQLHVYDREQWTAPVASGSAVPDAMVVCPCTTATLSAVATGASRSLIERAADVVLKERRQLILVVRETPFSEIHLENMLRLARMGAVIMPANPGFYHRPTRIEELVDFMVARVLDHLGLEQELVARWGEDVPDDD